MQQHPDDEQPAPAVFGPEWTVTAKTAAALLGVDQRRVQHLMEHGDLDVHHEGQYRYIPLDSLFAYRTRYPHPPRPR